MAIQLQQQIFEVFSDHNGSVLRQQPGASCKAVLGNQCMTQRSYNACMLQALWAVLSFTVTIRRKLVAEMRTHCLNLPMKDLQIIAVIWAKRRNTRLWSVGDGHAQKKHSDQRTVAVCSQLKQGPKLGWKAWKHLVSFINFSSKKPPCWNLGETTRDYFLVL